MTFLFSSFRELSLPSFSLIVSFFSSFSPSWWFSSFPLFYFSSSSFSLGNYLFFLSVLRLPLLLPLLLLLFPTHIPPPLPLRLFSLVLGVEFRLKLHHSNRLRIRSLEFLHTVTLSSSVRFPKPRLLKLMTCDGAVNRKCSSMSALNTPPTLTHSFTFTHCRCVNVLKLHTVG